MSVQIHGFEELADELNRLSNQAESVSGENEVSLGELFPPGFMRTYTRYSSIQKFFEESPWTIRAEKDFEQIPEKKFDRYVDKNTEFSSWDGMLSAAAREWVSRQLEL